MDFLFPKKCVICKKGTDYICFKCFSKISYDVKPICAVCNKLALSGITHPGCQNKFTIDAVFSSVIFNFTIRKILYSFKYQPFISDLADDITNIFYEEFIQNEYFFNLYNKYSPVLVPIPLSDAKLRSRGYNHSELIAKKLGFKLNLPVLNLLKRIKDTKPQFGLKKDARKENLKGAFEINSTLISNLFRELSKKSKILQTTSQNDNKISAVFLVDDVFTTGSTFLEAANVLKRSGIKNVYGLSFAREQNF